MNTKHSLLSLIDQFKTLNLHSEDELESLSYEHIHEFYDLLMVTGSFISKSCGQLNKLYEKTTQLSLLIEEKEKDDTIDHITHVKHSYGSDIIIHHKDGSETGVEVKTSSVREDKRYQSSWTFNIKVNNKINEKADPEKFILDQIHEKYNGLVKFGAVCKAKMMYKASLSGLFVSLLFTKSLYIKGSYKDKKTFNLGGPYCECHKTYHRIEKLMSYDSKLQDRIQKMKKSKTIKTDIFNNKEWNDILSYTKCK